jgi:hypothetical protein
MPPPSGCHKSHPPDGGRRIFTVADVPQTDPEREPPKPDRTISPRRPRLSATGVQSHALLRERPPLARPPSLTLLASPRPAAKSAHREVVENERLVYSEALSEENVIVGAAIVGTSDGRRVRDGSDSHPASTRTVRTSTGESHAAPVWSTPSDPRQGAPGTAGMVPRFDVLHWLTKEPPKCGSSFTPQRVSPSSRRSMTPRASRT